MSKLTDHFHAAHAAARGEKPMNLHIKKGALHAQLGVPQKDKIPVARLESAAKSGSALERKRANLALNMRNWDHARGSK